MSYVYAISPHGEPIIVNEAIMIELCQSEGYKHCRGTSKMFPYISHNAIMSECFRRLQTYLDNLYLSKPKKEKKNSRHETAHSLQATKSNLKSLSPIV